MIVAAATAVDASQGTAAAQQAQGKKAGDLMLRLRGIGVIPDESSSVSVIGGSIDATNTATPEFDISYFFTDNFAVELIAAATKHDIKAKGTTIGSPTLGSTWLLPPTVTVQYHPMPRERFSPYVGLGANVSFFFDEKPNRGAGITGLKIDNGVGVALQAGIDVNIQGNWYANFDVKKLFLNVDGKVNGGAIKADVDLDPWIIGLGVGYKF
ncbi:MAG: OmpW family protein [Alphaproteobacteria bacterium]|nr:OmpW family protein [Alphaproteobacteria bacterium]